MISCADDKDLILGTAMWGWSIEQSTAFSLLDSFYESGYRWIDTATNYPINKKIDDFRCAEKWLEDWCRSNQIHDMRILVKIGSVRNDGGSEINLTPSFLLMSADFYQQRFAENLACLSVHWDNREDLDEIQDSVSMLRSIAKTGLKVGLSGVRRPGLYAEAAPDLLEHWLIQVKENLLTSEARKHYQLFFPHSRYLAYGINSGGLSFHQNLSPSSSLILRKSTVLTNLNRFEEFLADVAGYRGSPRTFNELALLAMYINTILSGIIIGPSKIEHLHESLKYWQILQEGIDQKTIELYERILLKKV